MRHARLHTSCAVRRSGVHAAGTRACGPRGGFVGVREQLVALAKLGRIDASTQDLDRELKEIPKEVDGLRESVTLLEGLLARERNQLEEAQRLRDQQDGLLKEAGESISRTKAKSSKAKN